MSLPVICECGTRFEVRETYAGHTVECPECGRPTRAGDSPADPLRTSGLAITSFILALAGGFTFFVGPALALIFGVLAHLKISQSGGRLLGRGYATAGIVLGFFFVGLTVLTFVRGELFDAGERLREQVMARHLTFDGPLTRVNEEDEFAITRPSRRWGEATQAYLDAQDEEGYVILCPSKALGVQVLREWDSSLTLDDLEEHVAEHLGLRGRRWTASRGRSWWSDVRVRKRDRWSLGANRERIELVIEGMIEGERRRVIIRLEQIEGRYFQLWAWAPARQFEACEAELRQALDSFRLVKRSDDPSREGGRR
jgi:hypothetical protein